MQATTNVSIKRSLATIKQKHSRGSKANVEPMKIPEELADLIKEEDNKSSYVGGIVAAIVIAILLGLIALATYLTMPKPDVSSHQASFCFDDIFQIASLKANFEFEWKENNLIFRNGSEDFSVIKVYEQYHSKKKLLLPKEYYRKGMTISTDMSMWLIPRHHMKTTYQEDTVQYELFSLTNHGKLQKSLQISNDSDRNYFTSVAWGPKKHDMVAIFRRNIYYSQNPFSTSSFICLSCHLSQSRLHGQFIGYYEKHIFKTKKAFWWNSDGRFLAFLSMDREVDKLEVVEITKYNGFNQEFANISYAKAGLSPLPYSCLIYAVDLRLQKRFYINISLFSPFKPYFIIHLQWYNSSALLVSVMSHEQNCAAILICSLVEQNCFIILQQNFYSGWINMPEYQNMIPFVERNAIVIAITTSENMYARRQLAILKIERHSKNIIKWLTAGTNYILQLHIFNQKNGNIFYTASSANNTAQHLYRTNMDNRITECVTCQISLCTRNKVYFSSTNIIFLQECLGGNFNDFVLFSIQSRRVKSLWSLDLGWNSDVREFLKGKSLSKVEYVPISLVDNHRNYHVVVKIYHPYVLNAEHVTKYPVVLILPDDPFHSNIQEDSQMEWIEYLTSYLKFVVIRMEVRGTGNRYLNYHISLRKTLGTDDMKDIINGMKAIFQQRKYLDNSSLAVIGQKYGGYMTAKLLYEHDNFPHFRCGMAINPIVDFSIYNSMFAERYLQIYKTENLYYKTSKLKFLSKAFTNEFLLLHDMNQNDVLVDNSFKLIKELVYNNIQFDYVPIYGDYSMPVQWNQDRFVLRKITIFLTNCFNKSSSQYSLLANHDFHSF